MKNKISKILGVVLTAITVVSIFAFAAPASAAITPQTWTKQSLPGATGYVMPNNIAVSGPIAQAADGTLYVYVQDTATAPNHILKSTNGGRTWAASGTVGQPTGVVSTLVAYGTSNVYYTQGASLYRSTDAGVTFINIATATGPITCLDVGTWSGRNIIVLGTSGAGGNVWYVDESDPFFAVLLLGTAPGDFATATGGTPLAVAVSSNFGTDRGVAAVSTTGVVSYDVLGGQWGAIIGSAPTVGAITAAAIKFTVDWNATTNPNFYFACNLGVYQFRGGGPGASSTLLLTTTAALPSSFGTAKVVSLDVTGTFAGATIFAGLGNMGTKSLLIFSTNAGGSWTASSKLYGPGAKNAYVLLAKDYATSSKVYVLVGGTGLVPNDQSGFSYSVDKGVSFNQISLINDSISVINDLAASSGTTFVSTSFTTGTDPTTAGTFTVTAGSYNTVVTPAITASVARLTATGAGTAILGLTPGGAFNVSVYTVGNVLVANTATTGWNSVTKVVYFVNAGDYALITAAADNTVFSATINTTGIVPVGNVSVTGPGMWTGTDPSYQFTLATTSHATVYSALATDTVVTLNPIPTAAQIGSTGPTLSNATYNNITGVITFAAVGGTAKFTNNDSAPWTVTTAVATYSTGASITNAPTLNLNAAGAIAWAGSGTTWPGTPFTLVAGITGTNRDSIWRWDGTWFERVFVGARTLLPTSGTVPVFAPNTVVGTATMVRVSSTYATDKTVFYAAVGGIVLTYSTNNGQTWKAQLTNVGYTNGYVDQITSLLVVDGNTQYVGSNSAGISKVVKTSSNGIFWTEALLTNIAGASLTGAVSDLSLASNGDLLAAVTNAGATYILKSKDAGVTFASLADPNDSTGATDATLAASPAVSYNGVFYGGAFVKPAADYATTGNIFVTLTTPGGVYRYPYVSTTATNGWAQVDDNTYDGNGDVLHGTGLVTAAGGPGSTVEGSGMVYATDSGAATEGVSRIRGLSFEAEALRSPTGITFSGLWASSVALGNVQLWTVGSNMALYTYIDTLGIAGTGVALNGTTFSGLTIYGVDLTGTVLGGLSGSWTDVVKWNAVTNAVRYAIYVTTDPLDPASLDLYAADLTGDLLYSNIPQISLAPLFPNTTYYVSVWGITAIPTLAPTLCSTFLFDKKPLSITTAPGIPNWTPNLVPNDGAQDVRVAPTLFAWDDVLGATSYDFQIAEGSSIPSGTAIVSLPTSSYSITTLKNATVYTWQVRSVSGTVVGAWVTSTFSTIAVTPPPVTVTNAAPQVTPTIVVSYAPPITVTQVNPVTPIITLPQQTIVIAQPTQTTPTYIWIIVGVGGLLTLAVIILIIRTRRVV